MKITLLYILLTSICFAAQDAATVRFANGDKLSGNAIALNLEMLTWESETLKEQAKFKLNQILDLSLPAEFDAKISDAASHQALLELTNGDSVKGLLTGLNDQEIRLKTWYAGEMVFRKTNVKSISISRGSKIIYRGPDGIDGWKLSGEENSWKFSNGEFVSSKIGSLARDFDFPEAAQVSYDVSWRGTLRSKIVLFSTDLTTSNPRNGYEIIFHGSMVQLRRLSDSAWLYSKTNPRRMQPNEKARIDIRYSRKSNQMMIFIDEEIFGMWDNLELDAATGEGLHFVSMENNETSVSNIAISHWDGYVDESAIEEIELRVQRFPGHLQMQRGMEAPNPDEKELPESRMSLSNGDTLEGEVLAIDGDMIKIKTPFTEVSFPVHRINNITLKKASSETPKLYNGDVRTILADGSKLVFRLDEVKEGKLIGYSQNFGRAEFAQSAFKRIEFNIHPKPKAN